MYIVQTYSLFMTDLFSLQPACGDIRAKPRPFENWCLEGEESCPILCSTGGQNYCEKQGFSGVVAGGNLNIIQ